MRVGDIVEPSVLNYKIKLKPIPRYEVIEEQYGFYHLKNIKNKHDIIAIEVSEADLYYDVVKKYFPKNY